MKVFPQEVHHYHHHYLQGFGGAPNGGSCTPNGAHFSNGGSGGSMPSQGVGPGGSTGFNFPAQDGQQQQQGGGVGGGAGNNANSIQTLQHQMRQVS